MRPERSLRTGRGAVAFESASFLLSTKMRTFSEEGRDENLAFTEKEREEADDLDQE